MATIFPLSASVGQQFQDYAFDGESWNIIGENWKPFTYSATEPDYHEAGFIWVDSNEIVDEISYVSASGYQILTNKVMDGDYNYFSNIPESATLPSQTGNGGKYLTTSGSVSSWGILDLSLYLTQISASNTYVKKIDTELIKYGSSAPISPEEGTIWIDSTNIVKPVTKVYNGSNWIIASGQAEATIHPFFLAGT
jgi:hypothetical protein